MSDSIRHFLRHYIEMVIAMFAGMLILGLPVEGALRAMGTSTGALETDAPAIVLLGMAAIMTVPMVGWMRYRGHAWRPSAEMAASMFIPTFAVIAFLGGGLVEDFMTLMAIQHVAMFPSMLIAMLLRRDEYAGGTHEHGDVHHEVAA